MNLSLVTGASDESPNVSSPYFNTIDISVGIFQNPLLKGDDASVWDIAEQVETRLKQDSNNSAPAEITNPAEKSAHGSKKLFFWGAASGLALAVTAPLLGKQPPDAHVWILGGEAPTFVKSETLSFLGGPVWRAELVTPVWPKSEGESNNKVDERH